MASFPCHLVFDFLQFEKNETTKKNKKKKKRVTFLSTDFNLLCVVSRLLTKSSTVVESSVRKTYKSGNTNAVLLKGQFTLLLNHLKPLLYTTLVRDKILPRSV